MERRRRRRAAAVALVVLMAGAAAHVRAAEVLDRVLAVVSGTVILLSDARAVITLGLADTGGARDRVEASMRWLIDRQLVLDEAARSDSRDVDAGALGQALEAVRQRFPSDADYRRALEGLGLDDGRVRRAVRDTLLAREYTERRFDSIQQATEEELREYHARHPGRFVRGGRPVPFEEALAEVSAMVQEERRGQALAAWMERLRRRADIREVYRSADTPR